MHTNPQRRAVTVAIVVAAAVVAACGPAQEARQRADTVATKERATRSTQAGDVMGARREAQSYLDSARAALLAKNVQAASKELREAAAFTRSQADSAAESAKKALIASADELDRLATRVANKSVKTVKTLDLAFARTQIAEAQFHSARAMDAWKAAKAGATSAEMVMVADHFERAAVDAGQHLDASAQQAVASGRSVAAKLAQGVTVPRTDVDSALASMDKQVRRLAASIGKLKG